MKLLTEWHGNPLDHAAATALLQRAQAAQRRGNRQRRCRICLLQEIIARYWLGENLFELLNHYQPRLQRSAHSRALLELISGQLLLSRRLRGAHRHLREGFRLAARLLAAADYFHVLNRHQVLSQLPLSDRPLPAASLEELLITARTIQRLQNASRQSPPHDPTDIYG